MLKQAKGIALAKALFLMSLYNVRQTTVRLMLVA